MTKFNKEEERLSPTACYCFSAFEKSHCAYHRGGECTRGRRDSSPCPCVKPGELCPDCQVYSGVNR